MNNSFLKLALLSFLISLTGNVQASTIFKCAIPIGVFGSEIEQGQELYLDIELLDNKPHVLIYRGFGKKISIHNQQELTRYGFANDYTSFTIMWKTSYLSMVYLGNKNWGAFLKYDQKTPTFPNESEFYCKEILDITKLF